MEVHPMFMYQQRQCNYDINSFHKTHLCDLDWVNDILKIYIYEYFPCMYVCYVNIFFPTEVIKKVPILWNWSYGWYWATLYVLGTLSHSYRQSHLSNLFLTTFQQYFILWEFQYNTFWNYSSASLTPLIIILNTLTFLLTQL